MALIVNPVAQQVIGAAITVHRALGPGLFESVYERCLAHEFTRQGLSFDRQVALPLSYGDLVVMCAYRVDFVVQRELLVEIKAVDRVLPVHRTQVHTYLRLSKLRQALLFNFNVQRLTDGLQSFLA